MKYRKTVWILTYALFLGVGGCDSTKITDDYGFTTKTYKYLNESGVEVAIVGEINENFGIPDSLVLQNGAFQGFSMTYNGMTAGMEPQFPYRTGGPDTSPPSDYIPIKVYYNKDICIIYTSKENGKNPAKYWSYQMTESTETKKQKVYTTYTYTYTFTAEDYQDAIKAQP